jgi:glycosyltransferase involved in cell wall biosynthesis
LLEQITPIILTYNEAPNIRRTLDALRWARDVIVIDSFSDDATIDLLAEFPQVRVYQRRFDNLANQCNYFLKEIRICSEWVLALDADYVLTPEIVEEMSRLKPVTGVNGFRAHFVYCVYGKSLRGTAYPPVTVLYRHRYAFYRQDGHAHRVVVQGEIQSLRSPILHDDRKPLSRWLRSQDVYMQQELRKLGDDESLGWPDRLRKTRVLFPFAIFFYCLFVKGGIRDGWAGVYYAFQRMLAEILLALYLIEEDLREPEVRGRKSETRKARSMERRAGSEAQGARDQKLEVSDQTSEVRGQKSAVEMSEGVSPKIKSQ